MEKRNEEQGNCIQGNCTRDFLSSGAGETVICWNCWNELLFFGTETERIKNREGFTIENSFFPFYLSFGSNIYNIVRPRVVFSIYSSSTTNLLSQIQFLIHLIFTAVLLLYRASNTINNNRESEGDCGGAKWKKKKVN